MSVRGQQWVVSDVEPAGVESGGRATVVALQSVDRLGDTVEVVWEVEPGRRVLPAESLPDVATVGFDPPERLAAFLDAVRWTAVTSADVKTLQSPFRSGVAIEDYQLEPVARAVDAPRVNLLLADDVGLGKTIEAGLVAQELPFEVYPLSIVSLPWLRMLCSPRCCPPAGRRCRAPSTCRSWTRRITWHRRRRSRCTRSTRSRPS